MKEKEEKLNHCQRRYYDYTQRNQLLIKKLSWTHDPYGILEVVKHQNQSYRLH